MMRRLVGCMCLGLIVAGTLHAEDIRGKVKGVTADRSQITLAVAAKDGKDRTLELSKDVKVYGTFTQKFRRPVQMEISNGLANLQPNTDVIAVTETRDKRALVTQIRIQGSQAAPTVIRQK